MNNNRTSSNRLVVITTWFRINKYRIKIEAHASYYLIIINKNNKMNSIYKLAGFYVVEMFDEHIKIYKEWINHWNNGNFYQIKLIKTFSIDHNNLLSAPEIYCSKIKPKLKEELDILNYKESLIENQI